MKNKVIIMKLHENKTFARKLDMLLESHGIYVKANVTKDILELIKEHEGDT